MTTKTSVYIATSLDGFIARRDGKLDWLTDANSGLPEGEDCGWKSFMDSVDALVMGRKTFENVLTLGEWPYGDTPVVVLSRKPITIPSHLPNTVTDSSESPNTIVERLHRSGASHLYIDGGQTIQGFLSRGLIDEITITAIPVILGDGIPLFGPLQKDLKLTHLRTKAYDGGFVQTSYSVD